MRALAARSGKTLGQVLDEVLTYVATQPEFEQAPVAPREPDAVIRQLVTHMPVAAAFFDAALTARGANALYGETLGLDPEALLGQALAQVLDRIHEDAGQYAVSIAHATGPQRWVVESTLPPGSGTSARLLELVLTPVRGEAAVLTGVLSYVRDITGMAL